MADDPIAWVKSLPDREKTVLLCWLAGREPELFAELRSEAERRLRDNQTGEPRTGAAVTPEGKVPGPGR